MGSDDLCLVAVAESAIVVLLGQKGCAPGAAITMQLRYTNSMARTATSVLSPFLREATFVNQVGHLSDSDIARATGAAPSTARAWLAGTRAPTGERAERLVELSALVERLTRVMDPSYIAVWLRKPVPALDDDTAIWP